MRPLVFLFACAVLFACTPRPAPDEVHFSGQIENHQDAPVEINFFRDYINNDRKVVSLEPDHENAFLEIFWVPSPVLATLTTARSSLPVFLEPGVSLHVAADGLRLPETAVFTGAGAPANNFLNDYRLEMEPGLTRAYMNDMAKELPPERYLLFADSIAGEKMAFFEGHPNHGLLGRAFIVHFETQVKYEKYQQLLNYPRLHQSLNRLDAPPELPGHYYNFLEEALSFEEERLNNLTYINFLLAYLDHRKETGQREFDPGASRHVINFHLAGDYLEGHPRYYIQAMSVSREMNSGDMHQAMELYDDYMARSPVGDYRERLGRELERIEGLWAGRPAPDFTMTGIDGQEFSLSDYRGQVVYLKFWASWCGPCMRQVPPAAELKERMAGEDDLVFMYVSIDTDPAAWISQVERHGITGVHARTPGRERGVPALYHVRWIPTFYIIGRDGNIFDHRPPMPSDPGVDEALRAALQQPGPAR